MTNLAILAGGDSGEAQVSLLSAQFILSQIDRSLYNPYIVRIIDGKWDVLDNGEEYPLNKDDFSFSNSKGCIHFEKAYVIIHGTPGEDGKLQGWLDMMRIPYPGCGTACSAITFNKAVCKACLNNFGIRSAKGVKLKDPKQIDQESILNLTSLPCFVKPNNGGSSFGATLVHTAGELEEAINKAFSVDSEVLVEEYVKGTELTCGLMKINGKMTILPITEVVPKKEFFDFEAKYENMSEEITPARISEDLWKKCEETSVKIYEALDCRGIVRIDYIARDGELFFLEVNTTPGMTSHSFIPQQLRAKGMPVTEVLNSLLEQCR